MKGSKAAKKNNKEKGIGYIVRLLFWCVLLFGTVEFICFVCSGNIQRLVRAEKQKDLEKMALTSTRQLEGRLNEYMKMVGVMKYDLKDYEYIRNIDNIKAINMLNRIECVHSAYLVDTAGMAISNQGATVDMRGNELVKRMLQSGKVGFSEPVYGADGDGALIYIGQPVYNQNNVLIGISMIAVKASMFSDSVSHPMPMGKGACMLIDRNGNVADFCRDGKFPGSKERFNLFDYLEDATYEGKEGYTRLLNEIAIKKTNQCNFRKDGKDYCILYTPIHIIDSYMVVMYETDYTDEMEDNVKQYTRYMMMGIFISFAFFAMAMIVSNLLLDRRVQHKEKELEEKAEIDGLTTLYNKTATEKYIKKYLENEGKNVRSVLFIIDVDNFKNINDTKGHVFGDIVLSSIGRGLGSEFRVTDIVGRIGGDEFLVFVKNIPNHEIEVKEAERLVKFFRELQPGDYVKTKVAASIGAAVYPDDAGDFETLYKAADEAVYKSKKRGKDGYSFYREETNEI